MPRNRRDGKKRPEKAIKKTRPPGKGQKDIKVANVALRRSKRRTSNAFASSKITRNRLTLPLTFLDRAIKSDTIVSKKKHPAVINERNQHILNEDFLALIPSVYVPTESSECGGPPDCKTSLSSNHRYLDASSYYINCVSNQTTRSNNSESETIGPAGSDISANSSIEIHIPEGEFQTDWWETRNITTNLSVLNDIQHNKGNQINHRFCHNIVESVKIKLGSAKRDCIYKLHKSIQKFNHILEGTASPVPSPQKFRMSTKRHSEDDFEKCVPIPLVPQSQWVYSTPDKQNIKKFDFEEGSEKILPAVYRTSKKSKVLYDIKNEVMQQMNLNKFKNGQNIPIDRRYLKTICESAVDKDDASLPNPSKKQRIEDGAEKENIFSFTIPQAKDFVLQPSTNNVVHNVATTSNKDDFNLFLSGASEESIDIHEEMQQCTENVMDVSLEECTMEESIRKDLKQMEERCAHFDFRQCRSALPKESIFYVENDPYEAAPKDYRHQLLMATQRPAKATRKIQKRHLLKAKSLSFENTPPGGKVAVFDPKRLDMVRKMEEDCLDQFENEFSSLNAATISNPVNVVDMPHTVTSGALNDITNVTEYELEKQFDMKTFNDNVETMFKFYPRRNFDPE